MERARLRKDKKGNSKALRNGAVLFVLCCCRPPVLISTIKNSFASLIYV